MKAAAPASGAWPAWVRGALIAAVIAGLFALRIRGISQHFWLLGDQIRDWNVALGSFTSLPLVGPPTHAHGFTIGPAFYWILWVLRIVTGPSVQNLPHGGGIGQAALESGADALLLVALWRRTRSASIAFAIVILVGTAPVDLALSATIWNPVVGSILARTATALILLAWPGDSLVRTGVVAAIAWCAVHAYTGAVFVALSIFAALVGDAVVARRWDTVARRLAVISGVVIALQVPWLVNYVRHPDDTGMSLVSNSLVTILTGQTAPRLGPSAAGLVTSVMILHGLPGPPGVWAVLLIASAAGLAIRYRADPGLLSVTLLPQALAIAGYALWIEDTAEYFYLSIAPAVVMTVVLSLAQRTPRRWSVVGPAFLVIALVLVPARVTDAARRFNLPAYRLLVSGAQQILATGQPMASVDTDFDLPATCNAEFLYLVIGGRLDPTAERRAVIFGDGHVEYPRRTAAAPASGAETVPAHQ